MLARIYVVGKSDHKLLLILYFSRQVAEQTLWGGLYVSAGNELGCLSKEAGERPLTIDRNFTSQVGTTPLPTAFP